MFVSIINLSILILGILGLGALSGIFSERVGIVNIAINGIMIIGAVIYAFFSQYINSPGQQIILLLISSFSGGLFALFHGFAVIKLKANHVISGVAINLFAPAIALFLMKFQGDRNKMEVLLQDLTLNSIEHESNITYKTFISLSFFITIAIFIISWIFLNKTKTGLRMRSIGENPNAADAVGINVNFYKYQGVFISGLLAGLSGAIFSQYFGEFGGHVRGMGFLSLAIMIMGQWRISFAAIATVLFTLIYTTSYSINILEDTNSIKKWLIGNKDIFLATPYILTIITLIITSKSSLAPKAIGKNFQKSKR